MIDSETEPCLMMDNVLENVHMPDTHSYNMVSSGVVAAISQIEMPPEMSSSSASRHENPFQSSVHNSLQNCNLHRQLNGGDFNILQSKLTGNSSGPTAGAGNESVNVLNSHST